MELIKSQKGFLTILTGKTDMGKSTITVYDCSEQLRRGNNVLFFEYEYCQSIIYNKLVSHFGLKWPDLFKLNLVDASGLSLDLLIEVIKSKKDNIDVVYIDYLDLLRNATYAGTDKGDPNELDHIQTIIKELSKLAIELNIEIIILSQTGSASTIEETVEQLNSFGAKVKTDNLIKMFIARGNVIDAKIDINDISHVILVDGYDLRHFSTVNFKEIYKD